MALFTDGPPSSIEDLSAQDSQLLNVANVEGIDVTQKLGLAHDELGVELSTLMIRTNSHGQGVWATPGLTLNNVVVTPPLKLWHTYRTLEMTYADAFNSQLNDRYGGRRDQFRTKAAWAHEKLIQNGLGIACLPVAQAAAPSVAAGIGSLPANTYFATMTWANGSGEEGASAPTAVFSASGSALLVESGDAPANAIGWNVYIGIAPEAMILQNPTLIAPGEDWLQANPPIASGRKPGSGQNANYILPAPRPLQRG